MDSTKTVRLIDSHAHLDFPSFDEDRNEVIERALQEGVKQILCIGTTLEGSRSSLALAEKYPFIHATAGVHPHEASAVDESTYEAIRDLSKHRKIVAIGEVGLDYHYEHSPGDIQREVFRRFISIAKECSLPLVVHTREAEEDTLAILSENGASAVGGVIHCYSGSLEMARACIKMGFYISIPGIVTFKKGANIAEVVREIPIERMLIETDAPYLAPVPCRGRRNEPSYVRYVAEKVAEIKGLSFEDVARITTLNAEHLFGLAKAPAEAEITYTIRDSLYLNITNRCTNACPFCPKFKDYMVKGHYLELAAEPSVDEIIAAVGDPSGYKEIVFCGFGEPLIRLDIIKAVAGWLKGKGKSVRINTDGLANMIHKRNILPELEGLIDSISISLNADSAELYDKVCRPPFKGAYEGVKDFIKEAKKYIPDVTASVVGLPSVDVERCRKIAEEELGVTFRLRPYNEVG